MQIKRMDSREKQLIKLLNSYFKKQLARVIKKIEEIEPKGLKTKALIDEALNIELEVQIGKDAFIPALTEYLLQSGIDAMELSGSTFEFNMTAGIVDWLDDRSDIFLNQINETTFIRLEQAFADSFAENENRQQLIKRIRDVYANIGEKRAPIIARTEVHNATQYGTLQGYKQGGLTIKIWVAVMDSRTRHSHASIDGEERPIDMPFSNGLMFPGDPLGGAAEVINCRCVI